MRMCAINKEFEETPRFSYTILKGPLIQKTSLCTNVGKERREQEQRHGY